MKTYTSYFVVLKWMGGDRWETSAEFLFEDEAVNWGQDLNRRGFTAKVLKYDR